MFKKEILNGKEFSVYNNANFSIVIDDYCNANCDFCVEALRGRRKKRKLDNDYYLDNIPQVLDIMKGINTSISITGGEPTFDSKLPQLIDLIGERNFRKKVITSNGSYLLSNPEGVCVLDKLIENKFNHLNISKVTYDEDVNKQIMKFNKGSNYTDNNMLKEIVPKANKNNLRVRMSCLVNKEGIYNLNEVKNYINYFKEVGVDNIVFRELMNYDFDKERENCGGINKIKRSFYERNFVNLTPILKDIEKDSGFKLINVVKGYYYNVWVYDYKGVICCFEKADLENMPNRNGNVFEFVFHPNGLLCGSWVDSENIIMDITNKQ